MNEPIDIGRMRKEWRMTPPRSSDQLYERSDYAIWFLCDEVERLRARVAELESRPFVVTYEPTNADAAHGTAVVLPTPKETK